MGFSPQSDNLGGSLDRPVEVHYARLEQAVALRDLDRFSDANLLRLQGRATELGHKRQLIFCIFVSLKTQIGWISLTYNPDFCSTFCTTASGPAPCPRSAPTTSSTTTASRTPSSRASSTPPPASLPASSPSPFWVTWHMFRQASPCLLWILCFRFADINILSHIFPQLKFLKSFSGNNNRECGRLRAGTGIHRLPGGRSSTARRTVVGRNLFRYVGGECQNADFCFLF